MVTKEEKLMNKQEKLMNKLIETSVLPFKKKESRARIIWMLSGTALFLGGLIFKDAYFFIGGIFLMVFTGISKFSDD